MMQGSSLKRQQARQAPTLRYEDHMPTLPSDSRSGYSQSCMVTFSCKAISPDYIKIAL